MLAKTGVARLALEENIPVVPIGHWGAQRILPYGNHLPKLLPRKTVRIVAGPPVDLSEFAGQPLSNQLLRVATDKIMTAVAALVGDLRGLTPPSEFYHPAVARRKLRQELRALQDTGSAGTADASSPNGAGAPDAGAAEAGAAEATSAESAGDSAADGPAAGTSSP